jgi:transcriptional regulator with XRE-family HTH domain
MNVMNAIGEIFRSARQHRNLSIDEVSKLTKIGARVIEAIEHGNFHVLPPTYMRSFIRTYSQFLEIPEPDGIELGDKPEDRRFEPQNTQLRSPLEMPENVFTPAYFSDQKRRNKRILTTIYSVVGCLLAIVGYLVWSAPPVPQRADDTVITRPLRILAEAVNPSVLFDSVAARFTPPIASDSMILEARVSEDSWISLVIDKKRTEQFTMEAGRTYRWAASKSFSFSLGNAGGTAFTLNGKALESFGPSGAVVRNIRIARDAARGTLLSSSSNPSLARVLEPPPGATQQGVPAAGLALPSGQTAASAQTAAQSDTAKPRPRLRPKPQPRVLIDPVVPTVQPPKPTTTTYKPLDNAKKQ